MKPAMPLAKKHRIVAKVDELMAVLDDLEAALEQFRKIETDLKE
jgi:molecular chaperone GrpE (heat shock protein)